MKRRIFKTAAIGAAMVMLLNSGVYAFSDTSGHWAGKYIDSMVEMGLLNGYPDGSFKPDNNMSRAEFVKVMTETYGLDEFELDDADYTDVKPSDWYAPYMNVAAAIMPECGSEFCGDNAVTRADAAYAMLMMYGCDIGGCDEAAQMADYAEFANDEFTAEVVSAAIRNGIMRGTDAGFKPYAPLTRAEMSTLIMRNVIALFGMNEDMYFGGTGDNGNSYEESSQPVQPSEPTGVQSPDADSMEMQVLALVNEQRAAYGVAPLSWSDELAAVAKAHSEDMVARGFFDHTNPDGLSPFDRMKNAGITYRAAAENIAAGQRSAEDVVNSWMNSSGHRKNILNASYTQMGLGIAYGGSYRIVWTQTFKG